MSISAPFATEGSLELLLADLSLARALFDGVPSARLLARVRIARDERDLAAPGARGSVTFTFDAVLADALGENMRAIERVKLAIARHARVAASEGPLAATDVTLATLAYAVAVAPDWDASISESFAVSTNRQILLRSLEDIGAILDDVRRGAAHFATRLPEPDPRAALFECCVRLATRATLGPFPASKLWEANRRLDRSDLAVSILQASSTPLHPRALEAELAPRARRMIALEREPLDKIATRDARVIASALARIGDASDDLRLDKLVADVFGLLTKSGTLILAASSGEVSLERDDAPRPSFHPVDWSDPKTVRDLSLGLERGSITPPRAWIFVTRGGDAAVDAVGGEMLEVSAHTYASAVFADIIARSGRPRDVMRLVTYFAVAPDAPSAAKTLSQCTAIELPQVLRAWLEALLPSDGAPVPYGDDPETSRAGRLAVYIAALRPYPHLFAAVSPLLARVSDRPAPAL
ncbi:hypothetical protein BH09MYX1_BH09MYX1_50270 [soil metagenome]